MNAIKKALLIVGSSILVLVIALVVLCLYALNRKQDNANRIAPAMKNRWKEKDEQKPMVHENGTKPPEVDASNSGSGADSLGPGMGGASDPEHT